MTLRTASWGVWKREWTQGEGTRLSSCAIQAKLDAILRNSTSQDRPATDRTQGNRVDFVEPQRNKRQSTPLPLPRDAESTAPGGGGGGQDNHEKWNCKYDEWSR